LAQSTPLRTPIKRTQPMLKIDVDGLEPKIVEGLGDFRDSPGLRSVNIKLNRAFSTHRGTLRLLLKSGFRIDEQLGFVHRDGVTEQVFWNAS